MAAIKHSKSAKRGTTGTQVAGTRFRKLLAPRLRVIVALSVVILLGWGMQAVWRWAAPTVIHQKQYLLDAEQISISPQPEWIVSDVHREVMLSAGLAGRLSTLDESFMSLVEDAFALHPWVAQVEQITKRYPAGVHVDLTYRKPIAVVEMAGANGVTLIPIDSRAVHLPAADVPDNYKRYLPRIQNVATKPPVGQPWDDLRVVGAADIATRLADHWEQLSLVDILPSSRPEILDDHRYFVYDLMTRGGTRVVWGAAPTMAPPGEDSFDAKLARLQSCVNELGPFDNVRSPKIVDVRNQLSVTPRTVKKKTEPRTVNKDASPAVESPLVK